MHLNVFVQQEMESECFHCGLRSCIIVQPHGDTAESHCDIAKISVTLYSLTVTL